MLRTFGKINHAEGEIRTLIDPCAATQRISVEAGDRFPLVPDYTLRGSLDAERGALEAALMLSMIGPRYLRGDEANDELPLAAYTLTDARVSYALGAWQIGVVVLNLADARYSSFGGFNINQRAGGRLERFVTAGQPRRVQVTVQRSF